MADSTAIEKGYESAALSGRAVIYFLIGLVLSLAAIFLLLHVWHLTLARNEKNRMAEVLAPALSQPLQPSPGHPTLPWEDMAALRQQQQQMLNSGGPLPGDATHVRIPIDDAIDRLLKSGALTQPWKLPATQPWIRPPSEEGPTVENRT